MIDICTINPDLPVLIAGPTASGKSALALEISARQGGIIVNGDALQIFANWQVLTARPSSDDLAMAPHALYGHVAFDGAYSVGHWLRDVRGLLAGTGPNRPIIVGGTGLYFGALTNGLVDIPATPPDIRARGDALLAAGGIGALLPALDSATRARIDIQNPMRVQRAWEVAQNTGRGLADWQDDTPPPDLALPACTAIVFDTTSGATKDWLNARIARRFDQMIAQGALEEARENLATFDPKHLSSRAIGAPELIAHIRGEMSLDDARDAAIIATRQYAKRQRTWFKKRMRDWKNHIPG